MPNIKSNRLKGIKNFLTKSAIFPSKGLKYVIPLFCVLALYFLPTIMAIKKNAPHTTAVVILNIFLGVTLFGWIIALVLACKQPQTVVIVYNTPPSPR